MSSNLQEYFWCYGACWLHEKSKYLNMATILQCKQISSGGGGNTNTPSIDERGGGSNIDAPPDRYR